ncbi:MAG TPA: signal peptidase I [Nitrospirota bacterium]|nr:signal peptidase I [Nitrospirota bacterium]
MMSEPQQESRKKRSIYKEYIEPFLIAAVVALLIRQFVVQAFKIPSASMVPTLRIGDHLLVNKFVYGAPVDIPFTNITLFHMPGFRKPQRGEIIVFKFPLDEDKNFIKRIVGVPGDKIQIKKGKLLINDEAVPLSDLGTYDDKDQSSGSFSFSRAELLEEQLGAVKHHILYLHDQSDANFGPELVPKESVFVMGDNRDNSQDSRVWGFVKYHKILGRALIIYWSWDGNDSWVRWKRIGTLIR